MSFFLASDFGFLPSNSGIANKAAWAEAITTAAMHGRRLYVPAGMYALELTADDDRGVVLTQSVTIFGDGPEHTVIDIYPKIVSFEYHVIWWNTPDLRVSVRGLKILGPTGTTSDRRPDQTPQCSFMFGITTTSFGEDNRITVEDIVITGKFVSAVYTANGDGLVEIRNSDITALSECVAVFETTNTFLNKRFHAENCRFASGVPGTETSDGQAFGICVYLHPHIAMRVTNCRFYDNPRCAIKQYSGSSSTGNAPKYSQYCGCHFFNCTGVTILTPGEDIVTIINGCSFDTGYIECRNKTVILGCEFRNGAGISPTGARREDLYEVIMVGCWMQCSTPCPVSAFIRDDPSMSLLIQNCMFSFVSGCDTSTVAVELAHARYGEISGCRFVGRDLSAPHAAKGAKIGAEAGCRFRIEHCSFAGVFHEAGLELHPGADSGSIEVNGCDFSQLVGAPINFNSSSATFGNVIRGRDNVFNDRPLAAGGVAMNALLRLRPAIASGLAISSAPQIVLNRSYDTFHVAGTGSIGEVHIGVLGSIETNKFEGQVHLIADGRWSLTRHGNVRPRRIAARNLNEVVTLVHDPATGLWYEH
jgi:hypothetical protein